MASLSYLLVCSFLSFCIVSKFVVFVSYKSAVRRNGCKEPSAFPHRDPLMGLDLFSKYMNAFKAGRFLDFNKEMYDKFGKTFQSNRFGTRIIRTIDPEVSKAIHATYASKFGLQPLRYEAAKNLWGNGIIVVDGEHWQHGRAMMRPSFEVVHLANFDRLRKFTEKFLNLLPYDGSSVDLMPLFKRLILDTTSEFIFGEAMSALDKSNACERFMEAFAYAQRGTGIRAMLMRFKFLHRDQKWWDACQYVTDYADTHVESALDRKKSNTERKLPESYPKGAEDRLRLVDEMAKDTQDRVTLRSHIISVFSPAHDGAAMALTNVMFHLARNSDVWGKLRAEILPSRNEPLHYELLNSYKYVNWVLKETHRLTPIATMNQRQCLDSVVIPFGGGEDGKSPLYVQKGDIVEISYRTMCRDEDFWGSDADQFVPERWETVRPGWEYTPFGGGPRSCPGMRLVYTESAYVLVMLLRNFKSVERRDPEIEWKEEMRMTAQSKNGCVVALTPDAV